MEDGNREKVMLRSSTTATGSEIGVDIVVVDVTLDSDVDKGLFVVDDVVGIDVVGSSTISSSQLSTGTTQGVSLSIGAVALA